MKQEDLVNLAFNILKMATMNDTSMDTMNDTSMDTTKDVAKDVSTPESAGKGVERKTPSKNINDDVTDQPQAEGKTLDDIFASIESLTRAIQLSNVNNANQPDNSGVESIADIEQKLLR